MRPLLFVAACLTLDSVEKVNPRMDAARAQRRTYDGRECANCSATLRYTSSGSCVACIREKGRESANRIRALLRGESVA